jgi:phenylpyruvate tautomerase PptA (4-oxalocrotonate tautomerase family)
MPMVDVYIPEGALLPDVEDRLLEEITDAVIRIETFEPAAERPKSTMWVLLYRPKIFIGSNIPALPRYRFIVSVPGNQHERRHAVISAITAAVARAESSTPEDVSPRVWMFPIDVPDR